MSEQNIFLDKFNRQINVDDVVVYIQVPYGSTKCVNYHGKVVGFTKARVTIKWTKGGNTSNVSNENLIILSDKGLE